MASALSFTLPSPAKLNLFLHICGRRSDGYHNLQTLFQLLDYGDELSFEWQPSGISISPEIPGLATQDNLIYKAAALLQSHTGCQQGVAIKLDKNMPMGGGIGGGSSNAATALLGLNYLWQLKLSTPELMQLGQQLGADVPIFIHGHTAWAEGIGEQVVSVDTQQCWYLVIAPQAHVSTAEIFSHKQLTRDTKMKRMHAVIEQGQVDQVINNRDAFKNDCEKLVRNLYPEVDKALAWLAEYAPSQMTGTGACIFAKFEQKQHALEIFAKLPDHLPGFIAQGKNLSPLQLALDKLP